MGKLTPLDMGQAITNKEGFMNQKTWILIVNIIERLDFLETAFGSGSPEGVLVASVGKRYIDKDVDIEYYKKSGEGATGWQSL